jgi:hypothetical protein
MTKFYENRPYSANQIGQDYGTRCRFGGADFKNNPESSPPDHRDRFRRPGGKLHDPGGMTANNAFKDVDGRVKPGHDKRYFGVFRRQFT